MFVIYNRIVGEDAVAVWNPWLLLEKAKNFYEDEKSWVRMGEGGERTIPYTLGLRLECVMSAWMKLGIRWKGELSHKRLLEWAPSGKWTIFSSRMTHPSWRNAPKRRNREGGREKKTEEQWAKSCTPSERNKNHLGWIKCSGKRGRLLVGWVTCGEAETGRWTSNLGSLWVTGVGRYRRKLCGRMDRKNEQWRGTRGGRERKTYNKKFKALSSTWELRIEKEA